MLIPALALGMVFAAAGVLVVAGLVPSRRPLDARLRLLYEVAVPLPASGPAFLRTRWGSHLVTLAQSLGLHSEGLRRDLRVMNRSLEEHTLEKLRTMAAGLVIPAAGWFVASAAGFQFNPLWFAAGAVTLAVGGFLAVDFQLQAEASDRRREFRAHFATYLSLVTQALAGGAGVETALAEAAELGDSWAFERLRQALAEARLANQSPWVVLRRYGENLGLADLEELAGTLTLAGAAGARVREALEVRATALIERELYESESEAGSVTENMSIPLGLMTTAFFVVIGFPAIYRIAQL